MTLGSGLAVSAGAVVIAVSTWDVVTTVFAVSRGGGPLIRGWERVTVLLAGLLRKRRRAIVWVGPLVAAATTPAWLCLLWLGWGLVFQPAGSIVTSAGQEASNWERAYFAGYSLVTLGNGEFQPGSAPWQALSVVAAASGLIVITLGLGYLVALVSAATQRHTTAARVHGLGSTPVDVALASWDGRDLHQIEADLRELNTSIAQIAQQHLAYPALRHFHSTARVNALAPCLATLDEALTLMECGVAAGHRPRALILGQTRVAIDRFLDLERPPTHGRPVGPAPPPPDLTLLRAAGIPVVSDQEFRVAVDRLEPRRAALCVLVEDDGWTWADVAGDI
jgi:hypothetical protein